MTGVRDRFVALRRVTKVVTVSKMNLVTRRSVFNKTPSAVKC